MSSQILFYEALTKSVPHYIPDYIPHNKHEGILCWYTEVLSIDGTLKKFMNIIYVLQAKVMYTFFIGATIV